MTNYVDWKFAASAGARLVPPGPDVTPDEAVEVVEPPAWEDEVVVAEATTVESAVAEPEAPTPVVTDTAAADAAATDPEAPASATTPETPAR